jgi:hypothetical protein
MTSGARPMPMPVRISIILIGWLAELLDYRQRD